MWMAFWACWLRIDDDDGDVLDYEAEVLHEQIKNNALFVEYTNGQK